MMRQLRNVVSALDRWYEGEHRRCVRVRLNFAVTSIFCMVPAALVFAIFRDSVILGEGADGEALDVGTRIFLGILAGFLALPILHYVLFYYVEIDDKKLRLVRYFGLGGGELQISGLRVRMRPKKGFFGKEAFEFVNGDESLAVTRAWTRVGDVWPEDRLRVVVRKLAASGATIEHDVLSHLSLVPPPPPGRYSDLGGIVLRPETVLRWVSLPMGAGVVVGIGAGITAMSVGLGIAAGLIALAVGGVIVSVLYALRPPANISKPTTLLQ
jgi:hypothetical protein